MKALNFPEFDFSLKRQNGKTYIFDIVRKKYVLRTSEEWVRQHTLHYLVEVKKYSKALIGVEKKLVINGAQRRFDIVVFNKQMQPEILVECKAPAVPINQKTFDQANQYNWMLKAPYIFLTNGMNHYICRINFENNTYEFLESLPEREW